MEIKPGWKTTEFLGKTATQAVTLWGVFGHFIPAPYGVIIVTAAEAIYTLARTALKINQSVQEAKIEKVASVGP